MLPTCSPVSDASAATGFAAGLVRAQASRSVRQLPLLGAVSWLMLAAPQTRQVRMEELEWRVMPALMLHQARIYLREETPVAFASWAWLSPAVAHRHAAGAGELLPAEWKSGDEPWIIDLLAPFGGEAEALQDLRETVFAGRDLRQLAAPGGQGAQVLVWPAVPAR